MLREYASIRLERVKVDTLKRELTAIKRAIEYARTELERVQCEELARIPSGVSRVKAELSETREDWHNERRGRLRSVDEILHALELASVECRKKGYFMLHTAIRWGELI